MNEELLKLSKKMTKEEFITKMKKVKCPSSFDLEPFNGLGCASVNCKDCWQEAIEDIKFKDDIDKQNKDTQYYIEKLTQGTKLKLEYDEIQSDTCNNWHKELYSYEDEKSLNENCKFIIEYIDANFKTTHDLNEITEILNEALQDADTIEIIDNINKSKPAQQIYYGDEIIKMIREGKLKEGIKLRGFYNDTPYEDFLICKADSNKLYICEIGAEEDDIDSWDLINMTFTIKEKEYLTFNEARKSGRKFKHKDWSTLFMNTEEIFTFIGNSSFRLTIVDQLDDSVWEIQ